MTVQELINTLQQYCDPTDKVEFSDGSTVDEICANRNLKRVSLSTLDDHVNNENLAPGWIYIYTEQKQEGTNIMIRFSHEANSWQVQVSNGEWENIHPSTARCLIDDEGYTVSVDATVRIG